MAKKSTLGRGLDAVFLENETEPSASVTLLPLSRMEPNPMQPRRDFDEEALAALSDSIRENGIIQPIAVRAVRPGDEQYQIVAGERRWRAARMAGLAEAPVVILELDDEKTALLALVENLQREDLGPVEEARAYAELAQRFSLTQEQIAKRIGKSRSAVANALRLLELPQEILPLVEKGGISAGHARAILSCENEEDKKTLAAMITELSLSVRAAESVKLRGEDGHLLDMLLADERFHLTPEALEELLDVRQFVGLAPEQTRAFLETHVYPVLEARRGDIAGSVPVRV